MPLIAAKADAEYFDAYLDQLFGESETLASIEVAVWLIFVLLLFWAISAIFRDRKAHEPDAEEPNWIALVEDEYERGNYDKALETLATFKLIYTKSATLTYWEGRCYFQMEDWAKAVEKFEGACRREPPFRKLVREYMAFIELNALVPGVEGYLDGRTHQRFGREPRVGAPLVT